MGWLGVPAHLAHLLLLSAGFTCASTVPRLACLSSTWCLTLQQADLGCFPGSKAGSSERKARKATQRPHEGHTKASLGTDAPSLSPHLVAKANHKLAQVPGVRESSPRLGGRNCKVTWQRGKDRRRGGEWRPCSP